MQSEIWLPVIVFLDSNWFGLLWRGSDSPPVHAFPLFIISVVHATPGVTGFDLGLLTGLPSRS